MRLGHQLLRVGLLAFLVLGIWGCTDSPLSPSSDAGTPTATPSGPELLAVGADGSTEWTPVTSLLKLDLNHLLPPGSRALQVCADVDGASGGRIRCGRFVLSIPAGAFDGRGKICMSMPDSTVMVVDLNIDPVQLNGFRQPVKLCLITDDTNVDETDVTIYWYDPASVSWKAMACDRDLSNDLDVTAGAYSKGVLTLLGHFSRYSGGKAGW
jgi:hypothetical protein